MEVVTTETVSVEKKYRSFYCDHCHAQIGERIDETLYSAIIPRHFKVTADIIYPSNGKHEVHTIINDNLLLCEKCAFEYVQRIHGFFDELMPEIDDDD